MSLTAFSQSTGFLTPSPRNMSVGRKVGNANLFYAANGMRADLYAPRLTPESYNRFVVIGDAGTGSVQQWEVAAQLKRFFDDERTRFASVVALGDNVYDHGESELFNQRIYEPYQQFFQAGVRFYPILGNHDIETDNGASQLAYWGAPRFYSFQLGPPGNRVEIFATDTTIMMPSCYKKNVEWAKSLNSLQQGWLAKALGQSTANMKIVLGHYPLGSDRERSPLARAYPHYQDMFARTGVNLYLSGHEHLYRRSKPIGGVHFVTSGGAGKVSAEPLPLFDYFRQRIEHRLHFLWFEIRPDGLFFQAVDRNGTVFDQGLIPKPERAGFPKQELRMQPGYSFVWQ